MNQIKLLLLLNIFSVDSNYWIHFGTLYLVSFVSFNIRFSQSWTLVRVFNAADYALIPKHHSLTSKQF